LPKKEQRNWNFSPVETKRAYETVYEQIYKQILSGKLRPGDKLPSERQLMKIFNRSHPTIREAIRMLDQSGLVTVVPGGGTVIAEVTSDYIARPLEQMMTQQDISPYEILEYMLVNESEYIRAAAEKCSADEAKILWGIFASYNSRDGYQKFVMNDSELHAAIVKISGNRVAEIVCASIRNILSPKLSVCFRAMSEEQSRRFCEERRNEHERMISSIVNNNASEAFKLAYDHISKAKELFEFYY
jgi:GntR family transcriptional repressor for pyruvate dehydrogenase complex